MGRVEKFLLLDHDGVLVDTEPWYFKAGERALADIGLRLDQDRYRCGLADPSQRSDDSSGCTASSLPGWR